MDYFEWFGVERKFNLDPADLRKSFLSKSMELHPDKANSIDESLPEQSGYNNLAYSTLKDKSKRFTYILTLEDIIVAGEKPILPQEFLMEMLEFNMEIEEAKELKDESKLKSLKSQIENKIQLQLSGIQDILNQYDKGILNDDSKSKLKNFHYIEKYLLRIEESIYTFASH
ncbi:MAG: Fe-S protein assembly co-chaperone HscB [Saprospiraceae bacterium]|nr:Fe-S protein assembly co-chaperone HscB [Candidatus Brachybacter algidus]